MEHITSLEKKHVPADVNMINNSKPPDSLKSHAFSKTEQGYSFAECLRKSLQSIFLYLKRIFCLSTKSGVPDQLPNHNISFSKKNSSSLWTVDKIKKTMADSPKNNKLSKLHDLIMIGSPTTSRISRLLWTDCSPEQILSDLKKSDIAWHEIDEDGFSLFENVYRSEGIKVCACIASFLLQKLDEDKRNNLARNFLKNNNYELFELFLSKKLIVIDQKLDDPINYNWFILVIKKLSDDKAHWESILIKMVPDKITLLEKCRNLFFEKGRSSNAKELLWTRIKEFKQNNQNTDELCRVYNSMLRVENIQEDYQKCLTQFFIDDVYWQNSLIPKGDTAENNQNEQQDVLKMSDSTQLDAERTENPPDHSQQKDCVPHNTEGVQDIFKLIDTPDLHKTRLAILENIDFVKQIKNIYVHLYPKLIFQCIVYLPIDIFKMLAQHIPTASFSQADTYGLTVLHVAIMKEDKEILKFILSKTNNDLGKFHGGLECAVDNLKLEPLKVLLEYFKEQIGYNQEVFTQYVKKLLERAKKLYPKYPEYKTYISRKIEESNYIKMFNDHFLFYTKKEETLPDDTKSNQIICFLQDSLKNPLPASRSHPISKETSPHQTNSTHQYSSADLSMHSTVKEEVASKVYVDIQKTAAEGAAQIPQDEICEVLDQSTNNSSSPEKIDEINYGLECWENFQKKLSAWTSNTTNSTVSKTYPEKFEEWFNLIPESDKTRLKDFFYKQDSSKISFFSRLIEFDNTTNLVKVVCRCIHDQCSKEDAILEMILHTIDLQGVKSYFFLDCLRQYLDSEECSSDYTTQYLLKNISAEKIPLLFEKVFCPRSIEQCDPDFMVLRVKTISESLKILNQNHYTDDEWSLKQTIINENIIKIESYVNSAWILYKNYIMNPSLEISDSIELLQKNPIFHENYINNKKYSILNALKIYILEKIVSQDNALSDSTLNLINILFKQDDDLWSTFKVLSQADRTDLIETLYSDEVSNMAPIDRISCNSFPEIVEYACRKTFDWLWSEKTIKSLTNQGSMEDLESAEKILAEHIKTIESINVRTLEYDNVLFCEWRKDQGDCLEFDKLKTKQFLLDIRSKVLSEKRNLNKKKKLSRTVTRGNSSGLLSVESNCTFVDSDPGSVNSSDSQNLAKQSYASASERLSTVNSAHDNKTVSTVSDTSVSATYCIKDERTGKDVLFTDL